MAYMSQKGYDEMVAQLQQLETVERPKASAAIAEARDKGDLSENAEYDAAKMSSVILRLVSRSWKQFSRTLKSL